MDLTETTIPRSDQLNFDDVANVSRTVTIESVKAGSAEQPVDIHLVETPGRPFKPSKSMRRVLVAAWGPDSAAYVGRQMTIFGDPSIKFGGIAVGGIRIAALSHIEKPLSVSLTVTRGKRAPFVVQPLPESSTPAASAKDTHAVGVEIDSITDRAELKALWKQHPDLRSAIEARVAVLDAEPMEALQSGWDADEQGVLA